MFPYYLCKNSVMRGREKNLQAISWKLNLTVSNKSYSIIIYKKIGLDAKYQVCIYSHGMWHDAME